MKKLEKKKLNTQKSWKGEKLYDISMHTYIHMCKLVIDKIGINCSNKSRNLRKIFYQIKCSKLQSLKLITL